VRGLLVHSLRGSRALIDFEVVLKDKQKFVVRGDRIFNGKTAVFVLRDVGEGKPLITGAFLLGSIIEVREKVPF